MLVLLTLPVVMLQALHAWVLGRTWPRHRRAIGLGLLIYHLLLLAFPLALYSGCVGTGLQMVLRSFGHGIVLFQVFTAFHLTLAGILALWNLRRNPRPTPRRTLGSLLGAFVAAPVFLLLAPRTFATPRVRNVTLELVNLPAGLDGLRLAHLSDLHAGPHADKALLTRWRKLAEAEHPDLLLFTGDFVDAAPGDIRTLTAAFADFPAPLGRFAVLGNHDHLVDSPAIAAALRASGIEVVDNAARRLEYRGTAFTLFGLQDPLACQKPRTFGPGPKLPVFPAGGGSWRLALCHRPDQWPLALHGGADLTLCGHTHGGQINPLDGLSPARFLWKFIAGPYDSSGRWLHVSPGLGVVGLPLRFQAPGEITILTLKQKKTLANRNS